MKIRTIAVIGHVDHGKTALVTGLTGIKTDRLKEEADRSISIVPGYAYKDYDAGRVNFIDAPGHEDFARTTAKSISGAAGILLVVSAKDGICAQTSEHLKLAILLGVRTGIIAITKSDLVKHQHLSELHNKLRSYLRGTPLAPSPIVSCTTVKRDGMETVDAALENWLENSGPVSDFGFPYFSIDRVFSVIGDGTIVTGTLLGSDLAKGAELSILPKGLPCRARGLQANGSKVDTASPGTRVAINLKGISHKQTSRGDVVTCPVRGIASDWLDVQFTLLGNPKSIVKHMQTTDLIVGTQHMPATIRLLDNTPIEPGQTVHAQLQLSRPGCFHTGQAFVLRQPSPALTLGGGIILDPAAKRVRHNRALHRRMLEAAATGRLTDIAEALTKRDGGTLQLDALSRLYLEQPSHIRASLGETFRFEGDRIGIHKETESAAQQAYLSALTKLHKKHPIRPFFETSLFFRKLHSISTVMLDIVDAELISTGQVIANSTKRKLASHDVMLHLLPEQKDSLANLETAIRREGLLAYRYEVAPSKSSTEQDDLIALLQTSGVVITLYNYALKQTLLVHHEHVESAYLKLQEAFAKKDSFSTSEARVLLGINRKVIVPLLEHFDSTGQTLREGNVRRIAV